MIVSFSRRFIFVHTPKSAGESVTLALLPSLADDDVVLCEPHLERPGPLAASGRCNKHSTLEEIRAAYGEAVDGFFSFCFVRNPWDRVVSYYHYLGGDDFRGHVERGAPHFPCWHWAKGVDFTGRFEDLGADFAEIRRRIGVDASLPHMNASQRGRYRDYFDAELRERVARRNADDLSELGYRFEGEK